MPITHAVPVLRVESVERSIAFYGGHLAFCSDPFPEKPPYQFAILQHGKTELMLRRGTPPARPKPKPYDWDVYLRFEQTDFRVLYTTLNELGLVTRRLERMFYGPAEFEITDPDGYVLCLSQMLEDASDLPSPCPAV